MPDKKVLLGIIVGIGGAVIAPRAIPIILSAGRPLAKVLLKRSMLAIETIRERLTLAAEGVDDLLAEVRVEVEDHLVRRGPPGERKAGKTGTNGPRSDRGPDGLVDRNPRRVS